MKEVNYQVEWQIIYRIRDQLYGQVRDKVYQRAWSQVDPQVYDQFTWQVYDQVKEDNRKTTFAPFSNFFGSYIWKAFEILRGLLR